MAKQPSKLNIWLPFLALATLLFANNWGIPLWNADEAAYAGISHQMVATGDWLKQEFFWSEIHRKPPLHFWLTSISISLFGSNEWAVRFFTSSFILLTSAGIFLWTRRIMNAHVALLAAIVFCTNLLGLALGKIAFTDATLLFFQLIAGYSLFQLCTPEGKRQHLWLFWIAISLGLLTKGPQILIPFGTLIIFMMIFNFNRKILLTLKPWFFIPLSLVPIVIWGYMSWQQDDGKMISWMIDWYILRRVDGGVLGQTGPPGYYFLVLILAFFPYLVGFIGVLRKIVMRSFKVKSLTGFLILWMLASWLPFELIPSKLPHYVAGAIIPASILVALSLNAVDGKVWGQLWVKTAVAFQILIAALISAGMIYFVQSEFGFHGLFVAILTGLIPIISIIVYTLKLESGSYANSGLWLSAAAIVFGLMVFLPLMNVIKPVFNCPKEIGLSVGFELKRDNEILLAKKEVHLVSLPYYLNREAKVIEVWDQNEAVDKARSLQYEAIIGDSILASKVSDIYEVEKTECLDINHQKTKDFYVMIRK